MIILTIVITYVVIGLLVFSLYAFDFYYGFLYNLLNYTEIGIIRHLRPWNENTDGNDFIESLFSSILWPFFVWGLPKYIGQTLRRSSFPMIIRGLRTPGHLKKQWEIYKERNVEKVYVLYLRIGRNKKRGTKMYWDNKDKGFNKSPRQALTFPTMQEAEMKIYDLGFEDMKVERIK